MVRQLRNRLERLKGQKQKLQEQGKQYKRQLKEVKKQLRLHEQTREIVRLAAMKTQEQLRFHLSNITSLALETIFPEPYELEVEFVPRRNKTECDIYLTTSDGNKINPLDESGGGVVDVTSFALRIACWSMKSPKSRPVILLDEPFKHLSADLLENASEVLGELCRELGLQMLTVTHEQELLAAAKVIYKVEKKNKISKIQKI